MQGNIGLLDAVSRVIVALALLAVSIAYYDLHLFSLTVALVAVVLLVTALTRTCPIYRALGISTQTSRSNRLHETKEQEHDQPARSSHPGAAVSAHTGAAHSPRQ